MSAFRRPRPPSKNHAQMQQWSEKPHQTTSVQEPAPSKETERLSTLLREKGWQPSDKVVLFDGICVMCNTGVDLLLRWDSKKQFKYAALQSEAGNALVRMYRAPNDLSTMVYLEDGQAFIRSDAVLRIAIRLGFPLSFPSKVMLRLLPRTWRDWLYTDVVAKHRYNFFGKTKACRLIDQVYSDQFLS